MTYSIKKIAVTGAQGFLGSEFIHFLSTRYPELSIHALGYTERFSGMPNVKVFNARLGENKFPPHFLFEREIVFHFAYSGFPSEQPSRPEREVLANLNATAELLEHMRFQQCKKLVLLGSGGAIYSKEVVTEQNEFTPTEGRTAYAAGKLCNEILAELNKHLFGLETYQLRVSNVYGPGQNVRVQNGFIAKALDCALYSKELPMWVSPETKKDFIYSNDLFTALEKFLQPVEIPSGTYNLGGSESHSLGEIIKIVEQVTGQRLKTKIQNTLPALSYATHLDCNKFHSATGWIALTSLNSGIRQFWNWYQDTHTLSRKKVA